MIERPEKQLFEDVAIDRDVPEAYVEKDWAAVQLLAIILKYKGMPLCFSGGTALAKGYRCIERFSEDLDFISPHSTKNRKERRDSRKALLNHILREGQGYFTGNSEAESRDEGQYFSCDIHFDRCFSQKARGLRQDLKLEVVFSELQLEPKLLPVQSMVAEYLDQPHEVEIPCVDVLEIAGNKLSALTWRVLSRHADGSDRYDPKYIRHLYDLAILIDQAKRSPDLFLKCSQAAFEKDKTKERSSVLKNKNLSQTLHSFLKTMKEEKGLYEREYQEYIQVMPYARESIDFDSALTRMEYIAELIR